MPFEIGDSWKAFPDIPVDNDPSCQWYVETQSDVVVPAGAFKDCYRITLYTNPDTTIKWVCKGVGLVAWEYHHNGAVVDYRAELSSYNKNP